MNKCEEIMAITYMHKTYTGLFFMPSVPIDDKIVDFSDLQINKLKDKLSEYFDNEGKSSFVFISKYVDDNYIYMCVEHGNAKTMEIIIEDNKPKRISQRLFSQDIIRINRNTGEMILHLEDELVKLFRTYKIHFINIISPQGEYSNYNKFTLEPLKKGKDALVLKELDNEIEDVKLNKFNFKGVNKSGSINGLHAINEAKRFGEEPKNIFTSAEFRFIFSKIKTERKITISDENKAKIPECTEYELIEKFFIQNGFIDKDNYDKHLPLG